MSHVQGCHGQAKRRHAFQSHDQGRRIQGRVAGATAPRVAGAEKKRGEKPTENIMRATRMAQTHASRPASPRVRDYAKSDAVSRRLRTASSPLANTPRSPTEPRRIATPIARDWPTGKFVTRDRTQSLWGVQTPLWIHRVRPRRRTYQLQSIRNGDRLLNVAACHAILAQGMRAVVRTARIRDRRAKKT